MACSVQTRVVPRDHSTTLDSKQHIANFDLGDLVFGCNQCSLSSGTYDQAQLPATHLKSDRGEKGKQMNQASAHRIWKAAVRRAMERTLNRENARTLSSFLSNLQIGSSTSRMGRKYQPEIQRWGLVYNLGCKHNSCANQRFLSWVYCTDLKCGIYVCSAASAPQLYVCLDEGMYRLVVREFSF